MKLITAKDLLTREPQSYVEDLSVYNGLDCVITREVFDVISPELDEDYLQTYSFVRKLQLPALSMMLQGIRVDMEGRARAILYLEKTQALSQRRLDALTNAVWSAPLNPRSPKKVAEFLYSAMDITPETKWDAKTRSRKPTVERKALEAIHDKRIWARPFVQLILWNRELSKMLGVLRSGVDADKRMRTSYNIVGTDTARWSANKNAFGTGTNLQNITDKLRFIFVPDEDQKFAYLDLEQAESRVVGLEVWLATGDSRYLDECERGDLHVNVCKMIWPDLEWTGDPKLDREVSEQKFYRHFSYRDLAKRGGHGTNYYGKPLTMASHLKVPTKIMEGFQDRYFDSSTFCGIAKWHDCVIEELQTTGVLTTILGRTRQFLTRLHDDTTVRSAIAFKPQSAVADILNLGMAQSWYELRRIYDLLAQLHDAELTQYDQTLEDTILPQLTKALEVPLTISGREFLIPVGADVGWNWAKYHKTKNPDGLRSWNGHDDRLRQNIITTGSEPHLLR